MVLAFKALVGSQAFLLLSASVAEILGKKKGAEAPLPLQGLDG